MTNQTNSVQKSQWTITSPQQTVTLQVAVNELHQVWYELLRGDTVLIQGSTLALYNEQEQNLLEVKGELRTTHSSHDETWEQPWGEQRFVRDYHNEFALETNTFCIRFRLFDDGLGLRYELTGEGEVTLAREATEFNIRPSAEAWWIPALGQNHYEHLYKKTTLADIDTAHTPLTIELAPDAYLAIHEAALYDYGAMNLVPTDAGLTSSVTPLSTGHITTVSLPFSMPWRTVIVAETAAALVASKIMLNLNEPSKIADTTWIHPTKFMGIWWGMFTGEFTWASGEKHGATTKNALQYINAAKKLGISALLIEGWNEGWDGDWTQNGALMNHLQPYPDFDIHAVTSYATAQGVDLIGHHETSGNITHYEQELPEAYDYYKLLGVRYIKTGYVSPRLDTGEFHSSVCGVKHYQKTVEMAAARHIMLDIHEPVKGTGIERTWPNLMTREGVMGQEYEGGAIIPEHTAVLPFTRLLAGPLDYTPGLFHLRHAGREVSSTLAKQLAFYITMYSPMQMAADLPGNYFEHPAFQFIKDVPVNWETSLPLEGVIGDYYMIARKDRDSDDWYIGAITDENERTVQFDVDFLHEHRTYQATLYRDADTAHWRENPEVYVIEQQTVWRDSSLKIRLAPGGGFAIRISPTDETPSPYPL